MLAMRISTLSPGWTEALQASGRMTWLSALKISYLPRIMSGK